MLPALKLEEAKKVSDYVTLLGLPSKHAGYTVTGCRGATIEKPLQPVMVGMVESALKDHYDKAWGWNGPEKTTEMFHADSHYIILTESPVTASATPVDGEGGGLVHKPVVGFVHFRFVWNDDDEPEFPVLYIFELNVREGERGTGVGRFLCETMQKIVDYWCLWKIMLTCFKSNTNAIAFYTKMGYGVDVYSPSRNKGWGSVAYEIMSNKPNLKS